MYIAAMASVALDPAYRRITVEEFLAMNLGDAKAELEDGLIYMMTGGTSQHAMIAGNIYFALRSRLNGTGCRPFNSDLGVRTAEQNVRFPDVSVYCRDPDEVIDPRAQLIGDPTVVFEVLSPSTAHHDQNTKLAEYRSIPGLQAVVFVDPTDDRVRLVARTGPENWADDWLKPGEDLHLSALGLTIPHAEIFARD
ncbi:hypothetical protein SPHI_20350 [Sphingomonas jeddahensis]|uniref:Putative restriction endonuclease domain-containing protein n=2 Tax=Sphingomonas jeddahensis TaxID=1915074 RepID=A0A1V2ETG1_9SPHN|nr:hypothetical protein SPHI_20350 [Sphingomonas jeddahensis]